MALKTNMIHFVFCDCINIHQDPLIVYLICVDQFHDHNEFNISNQHLTLKLSYQLDKRSNIHFQYDYPSIYPTSI